MKRGDIAAIVDNGLCLGCGGCVAALGKPDMRMEMTGDGYLRPAVIPLTPAEQARVAQICPGIGLDGLDADPHYDPLWGPVRSVATGYATDPNVRYRGSSGGVLTALAAGLIGAGEIAFVVSTAASDDDPIDNATGAKTDRAEIIAAAGSRYAPSAPLAGLEEWLARGQPFAFVGKPCDVAALARMAQLDRRIDQLVRYRLAFFCAGVPSRKGTLAVLDALGVDHDDCARFQYRGDGWPGMAKARRHNGTEAEMDYNSSWGTILNRHLQFRCKICPDGTGEFADIACADAWYGKDGYPDFAERDGRSLIVSRTSRGESLLRQALDGGWIAAEALPVAEIAAMQPYQVSRKRNVIARVLALLLARGTAPRFRHIGLWRVALSESPLSQLRNAYGTFRRSRAKHLP